MIERVTWKAKLLPGMKAAYIKYHDDIWPEMTAVLNEAGVHNYTIWCMGDELFGYYEATYGAAHARQKQAESPVVAKWNLHMQGIMEMVTDADGTPMPLEQVFYHA